MKAAYRTNLSLYQIPGIDLVDITLRELLPLCSIMVTYFLLLLLPFCLARNMHRLERISRDLHQFEQSPAYTEMWFQENLDHINRDPGYINIRVLKVKSPYSTSTGPLIIYTGNEGPIDSFYSISGFMTTVLPNYWNCTVYFLEHRYYGASLPVPFTWKYLNTEQALFDYADIIQQLKPSNSTPVIVMGGSYGGMLAAWMRMKYTHIVDGAIASSAPILMGLDNGEGYYSNVTDVLNYYGCGSTVQQAFKSLNNLINEPDFYPFLTNTFGLCAPLADGSALVDWVITAFAGVVQSNYPGYSSVEMPLPSWPANLTCQYFNNYTQNPGPSPLGLIKVLATSMQVFYNTSGSASCFNLTSDRVSTDEGWDFQTCTELWCPLGTNNVSDVFPPVPWNSQTEVAYCQATYGVTPRPSWVQTNYGMNAFYQKAINAASNIFFVNGQLDPCLYGCVTASKNPAIATHTIIGGAHHTDLRAPTSEDPADLNATRAMEITQIGKWINAKRLETSAFHKSSE